MTTIRPTSTPSEVIDAFKGQAGEGFWFRFDDAQAHAIIFWKGGPKSPDRDIVLHHIEAFPQRSGHGTELLKQVCWWADERGLGISLLCESDLVQWYGRHGFLHQEARYGQTVMGRTPRRVTRLIGGPSHN